MVHIFMDHSSWTMPSYICNTAYLCAILEYSVFEFSPLRALFEPLQRDEDDHTSTSFAQIPEG